MSDADDHAPPSARDADAPPDSAPPEPVAGPPLSREESRRRSALVADRKLRKALLKTLKKCGKEHRRDIMNEGIADALAAPGFPEDVGTDVFDFVANKVNNARARFYCHRKKHGQGAEPMDDISEEAHETMPVPTKLDVAMEVAERMAAQDSGAQRALDILRMRHIEGLTQEEAAARANMSVAASYKATKRFTRALQLAVAGITIVLAFVFGPGLVRDFLHPNAHDITADHPTPKPPPSAVPTPQERAAPVVEEALAACNAKQWDVCRAKIGEALQIDPNVMDDPRVKAATDSLPPPKSDSDDKKTRPGAPAPQKRAP